MTLRKSVTIQAMRKDVTHPNRVETCMWSRHPFGKESLCLMGVVAGERQTPLKFYFSAHDDFRTDLNSPSPYSRAFP